MQKSRQLRGVIPVVQTPVNASGKNANTTFDRPRNAESVNSVPDVDGNVKSGASVPTAGVARLTVGLQ